MNFGDLPPQQPPKRVFKPKPPKRRRLPPPKSEPDAAADGRAGLEILQRFQENSKNRKLGGAKNSSTISSKPYESGTAGHSGNSNNYASSTRDGNQKAICLPSSDLSTHAIVSSNSAAVVTRKWKKDYVEPWDYDGHYPTTLPLRRPYSGDPEILNDAEFGENQIKEPNECYTNHAAELGLLEYGVNPEVIVVQLPPKFPPTWQYLKTQKPHAGPSAKGKELATSAPRQAPVPGGQIGKILVYNSGKMKWKFGDTLFDVSPGIHSEYMAQDFVVINTNEKAYCEIGKVQKKMTVTPDVDFFLSSIHDLDSSSVQPSKSGSEEGGIIRKQNHPN